MLGNNNCIFEFETLKWSTPFTVKEIWLSQISSRMIILKALVKFWGVISLNQSIRLPSLSGMKTFKDMEECEIIFVNICQLQSSPLSLKTCYFFSYLLLQSKFTTFQLSNNLTSLATYIWREEKEIERNLYIGIRTGTVSGFINHKNYVTLVRFFSCISIVFLCIGAKYLPWSIFEVTIIMEPWMSFHSYFGNAFRVE